ncbi:MAG: 3-dehydro-L-gulonate 2-dehydrogenase [Acidobacteria bacterium]|nr:3-dehydro-L-gulonate 2-dehydrogenase [Acidobacteriota bacterium]
MQRIPFAVLQSTIAKALEHSGMPDKHADACATLFAETTRDGVYTHGLNRLKRMVKMIENGSVSPINEPTFEIAHRAIERWNGNKGVGNLSASAMTNRAMELSDEYGIGCVALHNTTHWMRGGTYGWQAAERGYFLICWTNTNPNTPAWGTTASTLGNNPLVMAVPRINPAASSTNPYLGGPHVVLDTSMSQYSYGQLDAHIARGEQLAVPGGFDTEGNLSHDPAAIRTSYRALPIGFWKGSGIAMLLDLFAAMLSGGQSSHEISVDPLYETGLSQMFIAISPRDVAHAEELTRIVDSLIDAIHNAPRSDPSKRARYPGEETLRLREENMRLGVPVDEPAWKFVQSLAD